MTTPKKKAAKKKRAYPSYKGGKRFPIIHNDESFNATPSLLRYFREKTTDEKISLADVYRAMACVVNDVIEGRDKTIAKPEHVLTLIAGKISDHKAS